jgi:hypothetical protein
VSVPDAGTVTRPSPQVYISNLIDDDLSLTSVPGRVRLIDLIAMAEVSATQWSGHGDGSLIVAASSILLLMNSATLSPPLNRLLALIAFASATQEGWISRGQ